MTGPEHYQAAEKLLEVAQLRNRDQSVGVNDEAAYYVAEAQVHATLALAAATAADQASAYDGDELGQRSRGWAGVA